VTTYDLKQSCLLSYEDTVLNEIKSQYVDVGKLAVHYFVCGQGDPVVIVHGGGGEAANGWLHIVEKLSNHFTVYVPDLPGFGDTQAMKHDFRLSDFAEFIKDFGDKLGLKRFHLLGHSMGGGIALYYALAYPGHIKKLVLLNSMCLGKEIALWIRLLTSSAFYLWEAFPTFFKALGCLIRLPFNRNKSMTSFPSFRVKLGNSIANFKGQNVVLLSRLHEVAMPTLVVWGARDSILPVRQAQAAAELIPDSQLYVFEDRGHDVHKEETPELSQLLATFLG